MTTSPRIYQGTLFIEDGALQLQWQDGQKPPSASGIYTLRAPKPFPRLRGETDVLYIGRSVDLVTRTNHIASFNHGVSGRVFDILYDGAHCLPDNTPRTVQVAVQIGDDPDLEEVRQLHQFEATHGELPPFNRNAPGYLPHALIKRFAEALAALLRALPGFGPSNLKVRKPWEDLDDGITWVALSVRGVERAWVAWKWPHDYAGVRRPTWWPVEISCTSQALFLFVSDGWTPPGLPPSRPSKVWRRAAPAEDWIALLHEGHIPLPGEATESLTLEQAAHWRLDHLTAEAPTLASASTITAAFAEAWEHLAVGLIPMDPAHRKAKRPGPAAP
jgi:hypothetical protein